MQGLTHVTGTLPRRWGTVRLRMTLWNVAVLALILAAMGGVVRYRVQTDLFATVDRTLAERVQEAGRLFAIGPPYAGRNSRGAGRFRVLSPMVVAAEGSSIGSKPRALPPLLPRVISRDPPGGPRRSPGIDSRIFAPSPAGRSIRPLAIAARRYGSCRCRSCAGAGSMKCFSSPIRSTAFCGRFTR